MNSNTHVASAAGKYIDLRTKYGDVNYANLILVYLVVIFASFAKVGKSIEISLDEENCASKSKIELQDIDLSQEINVKLNPFDSLSSHFYDCKIKIPFPLVAGKINYF